MNQKTTAVLFTAALGSALLTGCGSQNMTNNAEVSRTTAVTETTRKTESTTARDRDRDSSRDNDRDRDNSLYEEDDVHRKTDASEPDILDRAETAMETAEDIVTSLLTEAKEELEEMN